MVTKNKWGLTLLGAMDLILIVMHFADYFILFLRPSGYLIPLGINIVVLSVIGFRSGFSKILLIISVFVSMPILLFYVFMILLLDNNYTKIDSPYHQQSLVIEYRDATLGETTYYYNFYKTLFGFVGKRPIEEFIKMAKNKEDGQTINVNGNLLTMRYDSLSNQNWIEVTNDYDKGAIPRQQCSRIMPNKEKGFYLLEECTHQWEYPLYPMTE